MVSFWHPNGGRKDESDFPQVEFWHSDRARAREEAGRHPGGQWTLRYQDLRPKASGDWQGLTDREDMKRMLFEARKAGSRA